MKSKLGVILIIGIVIFGCAVMRGARWRLYDRDDEYKGYYDAKGITHPSKNIVRVWQRWEYTDKGVMAIPIIPDSDSDLMPDTCSEG